MKISTLTTEQESRIINLLVASKGISETQSEKVLALSNYLDLTVKESFDLEFSSYNDCLIDYSNQEYLVCNDSEADTLWDESLESYIDECVLPEIPKHLQSYFDSEKWKNDARYDGRGHSLASYDGNENHEHIKGTCYYIYRTN